MRKCGMSLKQVGVLVAAAPHEAQVFNAFFASKFIDKMLPSCVQSPWSCPVLTATQPVLCVHPEEVMGVNEFYFQQLFQQGPFNPFRSIAPSLLCKKKGSAVIYTAWSIFINPFFHLLVDWVLIKSAEFALISFSVLFFHVTLEKALEAHT